MTKRRRMFEIDVPAEPEAPVLETKSALPPRRGPMAAAVRENAEAVRARAEAEAAARQENDRLAHEHVRLKQLGLIVDLIPLDRIDTTKLRRDRMAADDLDDLVASVREIGLSNPIRVEPAGDRFELIQGWRRLQTYRALFEETGDDRWAAIPAGMVAPGDDLDTSYRRMVDENLVRKDISFAEMAMLARDYAADPQTVCSDVDQAVGVLYASAGKQKRSYIRAFADLMDHLEKDLAHPEALPRNLGLNLRRALGGGADLKALIEALRARPDRTAEQEIEILRAFVGQVGEAVPRGEPVSPEVAAPAVRKAKTTFRMPSLRGEVRCVASDGRVELKAETDFSGYDRRRLEEAVDAFMNALAGK